MNNNDLIFFKLPSETLFENQFKQITSKQDMIEFSKALNQYNTLILKQEELIKNAKLMIDKYLTLINDNTNNDKLDNDIWLEFEMDCMGELNDDIVIKKLNNNYLLNLSKLSSRYTRKINNKLTEINLEMNNKNNSSIIKLIYNTSNIVNNIIKPNQISRIIR